MRTIKLCHGEGNGINQACLVTASNMVILNDLEIDELREKEQLDESRYVCPIIRGFIIPTNDSISEKILGELYGPLIWEIIGTNTNDKEIELLRLEVLYNYAIDYYKVKFKYNLSEFIQFNGDLSIVADKITAQIINIFKLKIDRILTTEDRDHDLLIRKESEKFVEILLHLISIGDRRPVETVMTHDELADRLLQEEILVKD